MKIYRNIGKPMKIGAGFSMVEILVASVFISIAVLGIARLLRTQVNILHRSKLLTEAAAKAEQLSSVIKSQPFDAVFSYDSSNPRPYGGISPLIDSSLFPANNYLMDLSQSTIRQVLIDLTNDIKSAGFDRWVMTVTYMRRDSSAMATNNLVQDMVPWARGSYDDGKLRDANDPNIFFTDRNGDGDYYDVVGGKPETPDTGLKMLNFSVFKNGESVGIQRGLILTKGGLSGNEIRSSQSPHKMKLVRPKKNLWLCQVTSRTKSALELPTRRTYPDYWWNPNDDRGFAARVDNTSGEVRPNKKIAVDGTTISDGITIPHRSISLFFRLHGFGGCGRSPGV